ncbi:MAG TPA: efflux RND transporter periplasmic adaptor subunit, partial [Isosphaeraceae bacterium]|nr:efflux RND transporter periplasmic adaptor subunit [Isosphaeraceae bacterium]
VNGVEKSRADVTRVIAQVRQYLPSSSEPPPPSPSQSSVIAEHKAWDGFVRVDAEQAKAIGLQVVAVQPQTEPIKLDLPGRTDYDPTTLTKIRPRFDTLVEKVRADLGQKVQKGTPLVDLFSIELAQAKNEFQTKYVQWKHDLTLLTLREKLFKQQAISEQLLVDTQNDERKSRLDFLTARGKLRLYEVPDEEIDPLLHNLVGAPVPPEIHNVQEKAKMTRLSPVDGIIISREVVAGNLYDTTDVLMVIAPLDHLFVWVNVYEKDQAKVHVGQHMQIQFPYLNEVIDGAVQYVSSEVSKDTRAVKIRASISNLDGKFKADMLVRAALEIPPVKGQTVIPRLAMVVLYGNDYAFVRTASAGSRGPEKFERRKIEVAEERADHVVVQKGLSPGEEVASNGSLIISQLFEDQQMVETGMPGR